MRIFSADEITRILGSQIHDADRDFSIDLGSGLRAVAAAAVYKALKAGEKPDHYNFLLEMDGKELHELEKATPEELAKISDFIWKNVAPQFLSSHEILDPELTPENLIEKPEDDDMTPLELRDPEPDESLKPDPTGMVPDGLREKKNPLDDGSLESLLTPDRLREGK